MNDTLLAHEVRVARERLGQLGIWYAARPAGTSLDELEHVVASDEELERVARISRISLVAEVDQRAGPFEPHLLSALLEVPRERFVLPEDIGESTVDVPLLLDDRGLATVSAPHAYLLTFQLLELKSGHRLAELGTGSGYGAALASRIVGPSGQVVSVEIDEQLVQRSSRLLQDLPNVRVLHGDASELLSAWSNFERVAVTFAVDDLAPVWLDALPVGGKLVAPIGREQTQRLMLVERTPDSFRWVDHGPVRYVRNRGAPFTTKADWGSDPLPRRRGV